MTQLHVKRQTHNFMNFPPRSFFLIFLRVGVYLVVIHGCLLVWHLLGW